MSPLRVLIADPDEFLLTADRELLRKDFEVVTAPNGLKCIARLREQTPELLEPQLPWGGGNGVLATIQEIPRLVDVPVMILTSRSNP